MSKQTAIANINSMILQEREQGTTRKKHSSLDTIDRLLEEEREKEQQEKEQRRQEDYQRQYSQFQAERNADLAEWIRGTSPTALEDRAQQARIDAMNGVTSFGTQHQGNGRSFETKLEIPSPSSTGATSGKKRAQDSIYLKYLDQADAAAQNTQAQRRSYTAPAAERTKENRRTYGLEPSANRGTPVVAGNIDLNDRPVYRNEDGSISTVDSVSFRTDDGREVLVPTIGRDADGNAVRWNDQAAWQHYLDTGEHLGIFNSVEDADNYAQSLHKSQEKKYSSRRTVSEIYNDPATMTRWRELAGKDKLSAEEKKEAQAAVKDLKYAFTHWSAAPTGAEMAQQTELTNLYNSLLYKSSALASGFAGAVKALGIDWLTDRLTGATEKALSAESPYTSMREITESAQKANPSAFTVGNIAGSTAEMLGISGIVGDAMKGVEWFTKAAPWVQKAISSAITFGASGLQSGATSTMTKEEWDKQEREKAALAADFGAEYTPKEYSAGKQLANVGISTLTGALAGAAGGALETAFGIGTSKALVRYGLQYNTLFRALANGINGVGFAAGNTAIQEASKFLQYRDGYTASASEIASNLAIAFLYSSASSIISDIKAAPQNRENLLKMMDELTREYAEVEMKMAGMTEGPRRETAQKVTQLTARIRNSIATSKGMSGVSNEVKALAAALDIIDDRMAAIIAGGNGLLGAGDIMAQAEAAGFSPNTALSLPAWNGTPSQPTNLEQAVQFVGANVPAPRGETPALPEAPAQANNLPAWYAAYQNAVRPIDQPLRQRPDIPAPAVPAPAAQAGGTMGPAETAQPAVSNEAGQVDYIYTPQLKQILENSPKVRTVEYNGEKFVTDGAVGVAVGDEGKAFAQTNYQATDIDPAPLAKYGFDKIAKSGTIVSEQPYIGSTKGGRGIYYFPTDDGILAFGKEYVDALDAGKRDPKSGTIRVELAAVGKDQIPILVSAGEDGSVEGFLFGTDPRSYKVSPGDLETLERAELKTVGGTAKATNPPVPAQRTMQTAGAAGKDAKAQRAAQQALATQRKRALADNSPQSLQEMGFQTAGEGTTHIFAENQWDGEMQALAEGLRAEGIEPTFFTGNAMNAEGKKVPTLLEGNKLAIQADNRSKTIQTLAEQALGHSIAETGERIAATPRLTVRSGNDILSENRTEAGNETQRQPEGSAAGAEEARAALLDGDGRRTDGQRAGEQAGGLEQGAAEREQAARQRQTAADRRTVSRNYGTEKVDNRSGLGITGAVAGSSSTVVSERQVQADPELRRISDVLRQKTGLPTTFTLGNVEIEDAPQGARAVYTGDRFILRADHDSYTATQLGLHELYHWYAEKDPTLNEHMRQRILAAGKGPELKDTIARYVDAIGPSMGLTEDISEADYQQVKAAIREEIYANAYSGINAYGANAGQFTEEARAETAATERNLRETEAATAGRTGPPVPALRVGGSKPRTAAEAVGRYSLNPQTIDYAIRYTAKDEQVKNQLALIRDGTVELADIQNTITKSLGRKSSRNIHDMNDYLQKHRKVWQRMWDIQQELADNGIRTDFVTMPGTKNVIDGKKVPGGLKGLPIEYVASTTGKRFKFTAFWRNIPQMLLDSMTHDSRERLRTEIVRGVEDAYKRKTGEKDLMPYLKDQFPIPKKREIEKVAGERKLKNIRNQTQKRVQSPIRDAEKTVGALNLNSACPMFTIGNNGCYLDACYLTQMANGATGTNLFRSAWYTGEILQIAQSDIELMNELGGLRVNGVGDTTLENMSQMKDALRHAGMRGLKVKIITKQRASLEVLKEMHDAGEDVSHITVQPSMDNLWIPAKLDDAYGAGVRGNTQLAQTVKAGKLEAAAAGYDDMFGRATKIEDGVLYRKYGFTPEQIRQMQEDFPFVNITPRYVVCTPREIAEIALNRNGEFVNGGKLIQTLMHGKVPEGCISDYGKRSDNDPGGAIINFGGARHVVERKDGKWHFFGEYIKKDGSVGKIIDGPRTPYGRVQAFIENNYTKAEQDKIWLTLKNQMCCQANDFKDACAGCQSLCARGCAAFSSEDFDYRKYTEREKAQAMSLDEPIGGGKLRVAGQEPMEQPAQGKLRVAQGNKKGRTAKFSLEDRPAVVDRLDKQLKDGNYVIVYHSMYQDKNGKLYSPMAGKKKVGDKWEMTDPYSLNTWYKSDTPENIADLIENGSVRLKDNGKWSFNLKKPEGGTPVPAALNPWNHASTDALNDQFTSAYDRENDEGELVTVECVIPLSEVDQSVAVDPVTGEVSTKPYEEKGMITDRDVEAKPDTQNKRLKVATKIPAGTTIEAKDSVGLKMWKAGPVHGQISGKRPVYLSRWIRNTRVLSTEETAKMIAKTLRDEGFTGTIPGNVVGLKLRKALEAEGVKFGKPQSSVAKGYYSYMEGQGYTKEQANGAKLEGTALEKTGRGGKYSIDEYAPTFYSKLEQEIQNYKGDKIGAASAESYLRGHGVKEEEIKWSGIRQFLEGKKSVTKAELLDWVKANSLEITEEERSNKEFLRHSKPTEEDQARKDKLVEQMDAIVEEIADLWEKEYGETMPLRLLDQHNVYAAIRSALGRKIGSSGRKATQRTDREFSMYDALNKLNDVEGKIRLFEHDIKENARNYQARWGQYSTPGGENYREILFRNPASEYSNAAMSTHWGGTTGVVAHARVQDFWTEPDQDTGEMKKVLFIDEIQSDWHNAGMKNGYSSENSLIELQRKISKLEAKKGAGEDRFFDIVDDLTPTTGLKLGDRTLDGYEVEYGLLGIGSPTRYHDQLLGLLSEDDRAFVEDYAKTIKELEESRDIIRYDKNTAPEAPYSTTYHEFVLKNLLRQAAENGYSYLAWTTGKMQEDRWSDKYAEGYRIEYDQNIPKFLNKYGKQWGAKVEEITLNGNGITVPAIEINDAMSDSVLHKGQPKYSLEMESAERAQESLEERTLGGRRLLDTPALKKLGVKVNGSVGRYANTQQLLAKNKAAKELKKQAQDAEKRLQATDAEIDFASGIAAGVYDEEDIPSRLRKDVVMELADYYFASDSANLDTLIRVRADINRGLLLEAEDLMDDLDIKPQNMILLNERTPERNLRSMFGERGNDIAEWLIQPVRENEAQKIRWFNKQMDRVREFTDSKGQKRELTREESALTMKVMEGRAAAEMIADLETNPKNRYGKQQAKNIKNAAENIRKGGSAADAAKEFSLGDRERDLAEKYAAWMNTLEELKQADSTIVETAATEYAKIFDEFYEAINDFLAAHGYEPIGYIKGYAPHMQPEENQNLLEKAFGAMGINTQVTELPANIAGQTAIYKPNKRWNPYFLQRTGSVAQYDIVKAYESYVDYLSDIFYHTDDIMRARQLVRWIRKSYAKDEIKSQLDYIETIREAPIEVKQTLLRDAGEIGQTSVLSPMDVEEKMQEYVEKLFSRVTDSTRYSNLVMWLENYANILAGKQSFADRGWEYSTGRKSLNWANRLNAAFQKANVAGNLSSAINQAAQVPMIYAELGERDFLAAVYDVVSGRVRQGTFLQDSDFLMEKEGKDYLYADRADKFINALFTPASIADHLVSTIAVRGAFNKAIREGKNYAEAMRYADDFGRKLMGSRAKGSRPLAYESKGFFSKMIHQFQVECANSWDHIVSDLPNEFKQIEKEQGKSKAIRALAGVLVRAIVGTFILNRLTDELYGGTPAPFDILGLTANFIASGQGLTTNDWIRKVIDNGMEKVTGQRIFGTKDTETKFSLKDATEELIYNVMNDLPLARNVAGVLGLGDQTIPLPGASGEFSAMKKAVQGMLEDGVDKGDIESLLRATFQAASQFVPGGRQIRKTAEGAEAVIRGGSYKNGKLQYPVEGFGDTARALVFGKNATQAAREYWAAGGKALSDKQTGIYEDLLDEGMSRQEAYDTITGYRDEGTLNDFVKWQDSRSKTAGVDEETFMQFRNDTAGITGDPDGKGGTVSGSKKAKVVDYIDSLDLTPDQKTALLLDYNSSYSLKGVEWSNGPAGTPAPTQAPAATSMPTATPEPETPGLTYRGQQYYDGFVAAGIREDAADTLARKLENNETSGHEQWRAIYDAANYSDREKAVTSVMNDGAKRNWELAKNAGCSLDDYISVRENYLDLDENGKQKQSEWNATLDQYTFSTDEAKDLRIKGTLWQILTGSESTKNNPYDKDAGRQVIDAKSGGGSGSGSYAPARLRVRRQPWETGETEYQSRLRVAGASAPAASGGRLRVSKK